MNEISLYLPGILIVYSAFLLGICSPGPNVLAIMGTSMSRGRKSGVALALGMATGSLTWALLTVVGLSSLLGAYAWSLIVIKVFGGMYLLWLASKAFRSAAARHDIEARELAGGSRSPFGIAVRGYIIQMTNPKAALAWIAIISLGLQPDAPSWVGASIVLGTFALSLVSHVLYAVAFSTDFMVRAYGRARRFIQGFLGTFFAFAGLKLLLSRN